MVWKRDLGYVDLNKSGDGKKKKTAPAINPLLDFWIFFGGVVLPATALAIEATTHVCAQNFFDPLPSAAHTILWAMVPIANLLAWLSIHRDMSQHYGVTLFANGMAVGIAILYSLMFLPLTPVMAIGILFFGLGLLGLSPLLSLLPLWAGANHVGKLSKQEGSRFHPEQAKNLGHIVILVAVLAVELPSTLTRIAISMTNETQTRQKGIDILRTFGSQDVMLRACYERSGRATDILGSLAEAAHPTNVDVVRELFYKVTGRTFNSFPIPESARATMQHVGFLNDDYMDAQVDDEFDLDPDLAGEMVSGVSRGLAVSKSNMNAQIDADAGVAQLDWFLNFANKSKYDREVRTRIKLPNGGAVNQASLIVDGKEYECQIMVKSAARAVYQAAVKQKKNPLLVSVCGQDTVLVQCYPVPPGLDVKLHLGVVTPLAIDKNEQAVLNLPQFEERNFQVNVAHNLLLNSNHEMKSKWGQAKKEKDRFILSGEIDGAALATGGGIINLSRNAGSSKQVFWAKDPFAGTDNTFVSEALEPTELGAPKTLAVVVDGSGVMKESLPQIAESLKKLPKHLFVSIIFVSDTEVKKLCSWMPVTDSRFASVMLPLLASEKCVGGQCDGAGLAYAISDVTNINFVQNRKSPGAILWVHPAQPIAGADAGGIKQALRSWRAAKPLLYDMQIASGPNQYIDGINNYSVKKVERFGTPKEDLELLFDQWSSPGLMKKFSFDRFHKMSVAEMYDAAAPAVVNASIEVEPSADPSSSSSSSSYGSSNTSIPSATTRNALMTMSPVLAEGNSEALSGKETMKQLAQLWAYDRIIFDLRSRKRSKLREALQLAGTYHLVTPISSGVLADTVPSLEANSKQANLSAPTSIFDLGNRRFGDGEFAKQCVEEPRRISEDAVPTPPPVPSSSSLPVPTPVPVDGGMSHHNALSQSSMPMPTPRSSQASSPVSAPVVSPAQTPAETLSPISPTAPTMGLNAVAGKPSAFPMMTASAGGAGAARGDLVSGFADKISVPSSEESADAPAALKEKSAETAHISQVLRQDGSIETFERKRAATDEEEVDDIDVAMDEIAAVSVPADDTSVPKNNANPFGTNLFKPAPLVPESDSMWLSLAAGFLLILGVLKKRFSRKIT
jgi:hypothetical protein